MLFSVQYYNNNGRDLQNRMNICFPFYNKPVSLGYGDRGEGTLTQCVTRTCCPYLAIPKTMQLFHVGHIIGFPSSNKYLSALLIIIW